MQNTHSGKINQTLLHPKGIAQESYKKNKGLDIAIPKESGPRKIQEKERPNLESYRHGSKRKC